MPSPHAKDKEDDFKRARRVAFSPDAKMAAFTAVAGRSIERDFRRPRLAEDI